MLVRLKNSAVLVLTFSSSLLFSVVFLGLVDQSEAASVGQYGSGILLVSIFVDPVFSI